MEYACLRALQILNYPQFNMHILNKQKHDTVIIFLSEKGRGNILPKVLGRMCAVGENFFECLWSIQAAPDLSKVEKEELIVGESEPR